MFANRDAIAMLVLGDSKASDEEKTSLVAILDGRGELSHRNRMVVGFDEAARMLGYKSARGVYQAIRNGTVQGFYGGRAKRRASGVILSSIMSATRGEK